MDQSMVSDYPLVDISQRVALLDNIKYPMAGMISHKVTIGVYNIATGKTVYLRAGDPTDRYFTNIAWSPDESKISVIELNRDQNHSQLVRYDAGSGERETVLLEETHPKYVEPMYPILFVKGNDKQFIYQSQRNGFNHLYLYDTDGKLVKQLTSGNWLVQNILGFDKDGKNLFFMSTEKSGESDWNGRKFRLVDTGGIEPNTDNQILAFMREQAQIAIDNANVIIFVTDIKTGMTAADQEVAGMLQRSKKPIVLAVNKMDSTGAVDPDFYEFYNLGLGDPIAVSAVHGHGTGDLLDACLQYFPPEDEEEEDSDVIQVAIIGKPNVGKSSLTNRILGQQRVIVSNVAGTTRDAIDSYFENETGKYNFIDTAGMRKKSKVDDNIEKYSVLRATMAIERSDVCLIMIDAQDGVTEQDTKVAGLAHEAGKACIIVVNKWDLVEKDDKTMDRMREDIRRDLSYMTYAPIVFISALTGQRITRLFELINYVREQSSMRITTGMLNSVLADAQTRVQPPTDKGRRLKIYYMTQVGIRPPHFVVFCNDKKLFHFSYRRYLENQIRSVFGLEGTPIIMSIRQKGEEDA